MQVRHLAGWAKRSTYYLARTFANQLRSGQDYEELRPAIAIHLMDFELFEDAAQAHWRFAVRDRDQPTVTLSTALEWNLIELPKADRLGMGAAALRAWVAYFEHWQENAVMGAITHGPVKQALQQLEELSSDEQTFWQAFSREHAMRDAIGAQRAARREGREEGLREGELKGKAEGKHEASLEIARRLLGQPGFDDASIARLTDLPEDEVRNLRRS